MHIYIYIYILYRKDSYTDPAPLSLFCGTYNVNGKANLGSEGLIKWLFPDGPHAAAKDLYVLGFQVGNVMLCSVV